MHHGKLLPLQKEVPELQNASEAARGMMLQQYQANPTW
jgi:hypothetical protein